VECGLKACLLRYLGDSGAVFGERDYLKKLANCWTHDLAKLLDMGGLKAELDLKCNTNTAFATYWSITERWNETTRYDVMDETSAREIYEAVSHNPDGMFRWIQSRW